MKKKIALVLSFTMAFGLFLCSCTSKKCEHEWNSGKSSATCEQAGETTYACNKCNEQKVEQTAALGHDFSSEWTIDVPAACETAGSKSHHCSRCDKKDSVTEIAPLGHQYSDDWTIDVAATCVDEGSKSHHCSLCDAKKDETVVPLSAHELTVETVEATCIAAGKKTTTCKHCNYKVEENIPALGHSWDLASPTCTQGQVCTTCQAKGAQALGHQYHETQIAATCTTDGYTLHECNTCEYSYKDSIVVARGHLVSRWTEDVNQSSVDETNPCLHHIVYNGECSTCQTSVSKTEEVERHYYSATITTLATCVTSGEKTYTCSVCNDSYLEDYYDTNAHGWNAGVEVSGVTTYTCKHDQSHTKTAISLKDQTTANLSKNDLNGNTAVELKDATINLDANALETLGNDFSLTAETLADEDKNNLPLTAEQKTQIGNNKIYNFGMNNGGADFGNGKVTISVPYELGVGEDPDCIAVWYIDESGAVNALEAQYSNGFATFDTNHFSYYTVTRLTPAQRCELYGHSNKETVVPATCISGGYKRVICLRCGVVEFRNQTPVLGHHVVKLEKDSVEATCTTDGLIKYACDRDGCGFHYETILGALGHVYEEKTEGKVAATCQKSGHTSYACSKCDSTYETTLPQLKHQMQDEIVNPTCTESGYTKHTCSVCGTSFVDSIRKATGHHFIDEIVDATCTTDGYTNHKCTICDKSEKTNVVPAHHIWNLEAPTCGQGQTCVVCGTTGLSATEKHEMVNGICSVCGHGCEHDNVEKLVAATCEEKGYTAVTCSKCNAVSYKDYINALGHEGSFECNRCHELLVNEAYFKNLMSSLTSNDLTLVVKDVNVVIPSQVEIKIAFGEIALQLDENGDLIGFGSGTVQQEVFNYNSINGTVQAVIQGNTIYMITTTSEFYTKPTYDYYSLYMNEETYQFRTSLNNVSYEKYTLSDIFGTSEEKIAEAVEMYQQVINDVKTTIIPMVHHIFTVNETTLVNALKRSLQKLFDLNQVGSSYTLDFNFEALKDINDLLYTTPMNEVIDALFGEHTFAAIKILFPTMLDKTVKEVLGYVNAFGIQLDQLVPFVEKYLNLISNGEMKTLAEVFIAYTGADLGGKSLLEFLNSEDVSKLKVSEFIATYFGITDTTEVQNMISDSIASLENVTIYTFVGKYLGVTEEELKGYKDLANAMIDEYSPAIAITLNTDSVGNIQSAVMDMKDFDTEFFNCSGTAEFYPYVNLTNQYDTVVSKVNSYYDQVEINDDNIASLTQALENYEYQDHTTSYEKDKDGNYIITIKSENKHEVGNHHDGEFNYKAFGKSTITKVFSVSSFEFNYVTSDCGNWVSLSCELPYERSYQYEEYTEKYYGNTLIETSSPNVIDQEQEASTSYFAICYNMKTKQISAANTMHQYMPDEANSVEAKGCNGVGKRAYSCKDCGDIRIEYFVNGHKNIEQFYDFLTEEHNCEKGIIKTTHCKDCNTDINVETLYSHETIEQFVDLKDYGYYGKGGLYVYTCPCEYIRESKMSVNIIYNEYMGTYTDELGIHERVEFFACDNEGGSNFLYLSEIFYQKVEGCTYKQYRRYLMGYNPETKTYLKEYLFFQREVDRHQNRIRTGSLLETSVTCEDGVQVVETCADCGKEINNRVEYRHFENCTTSDLKEFGSVCGGVLRFYECLCGNQGRVEISPVGDMQSSPINIDIEEDGTIHRGSYLHQCAVTDPEPCSLSYVIEELLVPTEGCDYNVYRHVMLGYNPENNTFIKEFKFLDHVETIHEYGSTKEDLVDEQGCKGIREIFTCKHCGIPGEIQERYKLIGEEYFITYSKFNDIEYFYSYDFTNRCTVTIECTENGVKQPTETRNICFPNWNIIQNPTCTQRGLEYYSCKFCHSVMEENVIEPSGHNFIYQENLQIYVCVNCNMQSSTGVDGSLIIEELSGEGSSEVCLGYWNRENIEFGLTVTMINKETKEPSETVVDFTNFVREESTVTFNMEECKAAAIQAGFDLSLYDIRINFVPVGSSEFDYGITFGNLA